MGVAPRRGAGVPPRRRGSGGHRGAGAAVRHARGGREVDPDVPNPGAHLVPAPAARGVRAPVGPDPQTQPMSAPEARDSRPRRIVVLAGGYGGAKLSHGLCLASDARVEHGLTPFDLTIVVNTGDDLELHG